MYSLTHISHINAVALYLIKTNSNKLHTHQLLPLIPLMENTLANTSEYLCEE